MLVQEKVTKEKDTPEICPLRGFPALLASVGLARRAIPVPLARARIPARTLKGYSSFGCDARLHLRGPKTTLLQRQKRKRLIQPMYSCLIQLL
ncbi:MAG: hypothetical protein BMS9Abin22_075 [Gammaproteobacteria bacterium]|nr:MAG: hypothetical protein BMS9Abin22_075 [Gammaproteobacteria bacterium]